MNSLKKTSHVGSNRVTENFTIVGCYTCMLVRFGSSLQSRSVTLLCQNVRLGVLSFGVWKTSIFNSTNFLE